MEKNVIKTTAKIFLILLVLVCFNKYVFEIFNFEVAKVETTDTENELFDSTKVVNYSDINQVYLDSLADPQSITQPEPGPIKKTKKQKKLVAGQGYEKCNCPNYSEEQKQISLLFADARKKLGIVPIVKDTIKIRNSVVKYH